MAALETNTQEEFSTYVCPKVQITPEAEKVTGIVYDGSCLYFHGKLVDSVSIYSAIKSFFQWLNKYENVVLVAHNGRLFDFRIFSYAATCINLKNELCKTIEGFVDSLSLIRSKYPKLQKFSQEFLAQYFCSETYSAHNAVDDVRMLTKILECAGISDNEYNKATYGSECHFLQEQYLTAKANNLPSLLVLVTEGVLKISQAENIAGSGLALCHLRTIHQRCGEDGLISVFSAKNAIGKPRVFSDKKLLADVISKICTYFTRLNQIPETVSV